MDKDPTEGAGFDAGQVDSIQNLDTARMALRWALERLRALEAVNQELSKKAEWEFRMRAKAEEDFKRQWESEKSHSEDVLKRREAQYENEFAAKIGGWEKSYQSLQRELESRRGELQAQEREFQAYCELQKSSVDGERRRMRDEAEREAGGRLAAMESQIQERVGALTDLWRREKEALESQASEWRRQAEEAGRRNRETEEHLVSLEFQARQSAREAAETREDATRRQAERHARETELYRAAEALRTEFEMKRAAIERLKRRALAELKRLLAKRAAAVSGADEEKT